MKNRIWEIDALRGVAIICMVGYHLYFDLTYYYGIALRGWDFLAPLSSTLFMLLCGASSNMSRNNVKRGLLILGFGVAVTVVTFMLDKDTFVRFGILQLLGCCTLLYAVGLGKLNNIALGLIAAVVFALNFWVRNIRADWLLPFGIMPKGFISLDYYPLIPYLAFFILGIILFRIIYKQRATKISNAAIQRAATPLVFIGKHSLIIYVVHQPLILALLFAIFKVFYSVV